MKMRKFHVINEIVAMYADLHINTKECEDLRCFLKTRKVAELNQLYKHSKHQTREMIYLSIWFMSGLEKYQPEIKRNRSFNCNKHGD